ncbi:MAG: hypothetical protein R3B54_06200 [Bdellovibrionota bacterium]
MGARIAFAAAMAVLLYIPESFAGQVVISSTQRSCVARLQATAHADGEYHYKVVREQREDTKHVESMDLPEVRKTFFNTYLTYPLMRSIANHRIGADNEFVNKVRESEFSFHQLTLVPADETQALVQIKGKVLFGTRTFEFNVDADAVLEEGTWRAFRDGRRIRLAFTESGTCALERALLGGENALIPAACAHLVQYVRGAYGEDPPVDLDYSAEYPTPLLVGNRSGLDFSGFGLNERVTVRFGAPDPSESEAP